MSDSDPRVTMSTKALPDGKVWIFASASPSMADDVAYALRAAVRITAFHIDEQRFVGCLGRDGIDPSTARAILSGVTFDDQIYFKTKP